MRFFYALAIIAVCFSSCATVPVAKQTDGSNAPTKTEIKGNYDHAWNKVITYFSKKGYTSKTSDKKNGVLVYELPNAHLSYKDNDGNIRDSSAFAITDVRKKINNMVHVYPTRGTVECKILLHKKNSKSTEVFLSISSKGTITTYIYNGFEINREIENIEVNSTGVCEKKLATDFIASK